MPRTCFHAFLLFTFAYFALGSGLLVGDDAKPTWSLVDVPTTWKKTLPAAKGASEYYAWYRCSVVVPDDWSGTKLTIAVEGVDDAREVFFNGQSIGLLGTFPPEYRSGLGATLRFDVPKKLVSAGDANVVSIRVYHKQGRGNFNVAAPVLFSEKQAIRMRGKWQATPGDNAAWGKLSTRIEIDDAARFSKLEDRDEVEATLKKLDGDDGPLSVEATVKRLTIADDLAVDVALAEPHIGQPLSMKWDERGRLWVAEYLQYPRPAGLKMVSMDKYLRTVYDKVPPPPPNHFVGADKITIHEDTTGDGVYDTHKTFIEGLNLATSFAIGRGGVFVLNPPYLLFYPDKDRNDVPDGDPTVLLEGFGLEDSHSIANSLRWGPDGWLYSTQGSTVTGQVRRYGTKDPPVHSMGSWCGVIILRASGTRSSRKAAAIRSASRSMPRDESTRATTEAILAGSITCREVTIARASANMGRCPTRSRTDTLRTWRITRCLVSPTRL